MIDNILQGLAVLQGDGPGLGEVDQATAFEPGKGAAYGFDRNAEIIGNINSGHRQDKAVPMIIETDLVSTYWRMILLQLCYSP